MLINRHFGDVDKQSFGNFDGLFSNTDKRLFGKICKRSFGDVQNFVNDNKWSMFKIGKLVMMLNGHLAIWII